ncbi:MAG: hypothetical protein KBD37_01215 [Burkholderiales bacterium]|nr:hypothetical protein [Burkholderiales bacterium]
MENAKQTYSPVKIEITQDKLVDLLLHAATREDIAKLDDKLDSSIAALNTRMDKLDSSTAALNTRMDKLEIQMDKLEMQVGKLEVQVDKLDSKVDKLYDRLDSKIDKLYLLVIGSILVPILLHFIK